MKLDILAFAAHPDDVELSCSGTLLKHKAAGHKTGIVDLTRGELGTRGSAEIRATEAARAAEILKLDVRMNLGFKDGFFENNEAHQLEVIKMIRAFQPDIILINAREDRHIDHGRGGRLAADACFLSGLEKIETIYEGKTQAKWRPKAMYHYIQDYYIQPDIIVDITPFWETKMSSVMAYSSQFYDPNSKETQTPISSKEFLDFLDARARQYGRLIGSAYGEGFNVLRPAGTNLLTDLI